MDLNEIMKRLRYFLDAGVCVEIRGPSGIGKTSMIDQFREEQSKLDGFAWGIGSHFFATYTPPDVTGYLTVREVEGKMVSEWSVPPWMRANPGQQFEWLNDFQRAILVLEEWDKANPEVKKAGAPVVLYGGVGGHFLHRGVGRVILSNHADDGRQGSTKEFDFVINRKILLNATTSVAGWNEWALKNGVHPVFIAFAEEHVNTVFGNVLPEKQGPFCTPRSLVEFHKVARQGMMDADGNITDKDGFAETAEGAIGSVAARDLITYLKFKDDVPNWGEIVDNPGRAKVPGNVGAQLMVAHICAFNVDDQTIAQAVTYVRRLRPEFHITFVKSATRRNFRLVNAKPMEKWTQEKPELVALINALGGAR